MNALQADPVATLLSAINAKLDTHFTKTNCVLSQPTRYDARGRNSRFELRCLPSSGRIGKYFIHYNRLHKNELLNYQVERRQSDFISELLPAISALNGVVITEQDILDRALPARDGNSGKFDTRSYIHFAAGSWFWYGGGQSGSVTPLVAPKEALATDVVLDIGCHGWSLVHTTANAQGALVETVVDDRSVLCGWDDGYAARGSGWLRFMKAPASGSGALVFKAV